MRRQWLLQKTNPDYVNYLSKAASISPLLARILINRNIKTPAAVKDYFTKESSALSDPFELSGMGAAIERIRTASDSGQKILVHGDYDADGLTATAILMKALTALGMNAVYFIPNRLVHGYGFNPAAVDHAERLGVKLIITVDCGITSFEAAALAFRKDIDVIITDHHEPVINPQTGIRNSEFSEPSPNNFRLPEAVAVINPKLDLNERLGGLSGAGVAFKLAQALSITGGLNFSPEDSQSLLDLAAIGTIADVVPLTGENRIIVSEGIKAMKSACRPAIMALKEVSGLNGKEMRPGMLSFTVVPRINAAGRMGDAADVVRLFLSESDEEALRLGMWLDGLNKERQEIEEEVYQAALQVLREKGLDSVLVISGEGWHPGVVGVVASRLAEEFYRPAVVLSEEKGMAKGSARSIPSFDICGAFYNCREVLAGFGGHKQAAGLRIECAQLPEFSRKICEIFDSAEGVVSTPELRIDADVSLSDIHPGFVKELSRLEPFGYGNPEPLLGARALQVMTPRVVGTNHLKMKLHQRPHTIDAIGFGMAGHFADLNSPEVLDVVFTPGINEWNGGQYLQLVIKAFRPGV